ncbi:MAG: molybdate ABC transporter substrate-binding protein [Acidimicrobiales bacterium]
MRRFHQVLVAAAVAVGTVALPACKGSTPAPSPATPAPTTGPVAPPVPALTGPLQVFAAASLTGAFTASETRLRGTNPGLHLTFNFAGSNALVVQIQQGAPADIFAAADTKNMQKLVDAGLVEPATVFARNKLEIAVAPGNPKRISGLGDLGLPGVSVVLEAPGVPAGDYTRQVLAGKGVSVAPRSLETDVKSALAKVVSGEADATVVYATDVFAAGPTVAGVSIPDTDQPAIGYPIAVVKASKNHAAARAFVDSAVAGEVQHELEAAGFSPPQ